MAHLREKLSQMSLGIIMIMLFLAPAMSPIVSAGEGTSARSSPDFSVSVFTLDGAGSVDYGTSMEVENATHVARIIVSNSGPADGETSVSLVHRGSPLAGETIVKTVNLGNIPKTCLLYTSPSPRDKRQSRMPSSA